MKHRNVTKVQKLEALRQLPLFESLSDADLLQLGKVSDRVNVRAGRALTTQGRVEIHMSVIVSGAASVSIDGEQVAVLGPGGLATTFRPYRGVAGSVTFRP